MTDKLHDCPTFKGNLLQLNFTRKISALGHKI